MADAKSSGASPPSAANGNTSHRTHNDGSSGRAFTTEQKAAVLRVRQCSHTAFYDILGLETVKTTIDDSGIKKAYRKLSLLTHPDKNGYSGADEAFKMVSRAFQILSDPEKKKRFDQFGGDPDNRFSSAGAGQSNPFSGFAARQGARGGGGMFEEEISPEELFRQFFGGGGMGMGGGGFGGPFGGGGLFGNTGPGFVFNLGGGPGMRVHQFGGNRPRRRPPGPNDPQPTAADMLRNFLPLILLFLLPILSSIFSSATTPSIPRFSIDRPSPPLTHLRTSARYGTPYYVNPADVGRYGDGEWVRLDHHVEGQHVSRLTDGCEYEERRYRQMLEAATGWFSNDEEALKRAHDTPRPNCERLVQLRNTQRRGSPWFT